MNLFKRFLIFLSFIYSFTLSAQNYTIKGKVIDATTGEALIGATVSFEGSLKGTITDLNGDFVLGKIKEETVVLVVQFISYDDQNVTCDFSKNDVLEKTIKMNYSTVQLEGAEVIGQAKGKVKAMQQQKNAMNIKNVVSSEQIEEFPDMNAADVIQRIPGITLQRDHGEGRFVQLRGTPPELTNFNINGEQIPSPEGDVRYVGLDVISSDQIEFIEVTKVLTPDMDGDGIAGNVNIITKTAESEKLDIKASLSGGYNNIRNTNNYQGQLSLGKRVGKFGFIVNGSYYKNNQGADNMEYEYIKSTLTNSGSQETGIDNHYIQFKEVQLRHYDIIRERIGLSATLDYKINDNSKVYLRAIHNSYTDDEVRRRLVYDLDDAFVENYYTYSQIEHDVKDRVKIQNITSINLGGENKIKGATLNYETAYSIATEKEPDHFEATFKNPGHGIDIKFDLDDPDWPRVTFPYAPDSANIYSYNEYDLDELILQKSFVTDNNITAKMNIKIPYHIGSYNKGYFKFGGKTRFKSKDRDIEARSYSRYVRRTRDNPDFFGPVMALTDVEDDFYVDNFLNKDYYVLEHMPNPEKIMEYYDQYPNLFLTDVNDSTERTFSEDYKASENIYATYAMVRHDMGKLMVLGGVRYERTDIEYTTTNVYYNAHDNYEGKYDTTSNRLFQIFLPSVQVKYAINNTFNIRTAVTKSYSRPNFEDVLPVESREKRKVKAGNPDLKYPVSLNIDFLVEKYIQGDGLISGGVFYKKIDDFVFNYSRYARLGNRTRNDELIGDASSGGSPTTITMPLNGKYAHVFGSEIISQFKLKSLPGFLGNLGVFFNYTYTVSEARINKRIPGNRVHDVVLVGSQNDTLQLFSSTDETEIINLPGQAKHALNFALYYESAKLYMKLSSNYHDAFLNDLGLDKDLDEYYDHAWHFDFTANYSFTDNLKIFADVINLSNAPLVYYIGTPDRFYKREYYSWWGRVGIKLNF